MSVRTQNGRVLTRNGAISCECCDGVVNFNFSLGPNPTECDCLTKKCFDPGDPTAPLVNAFYTENGVTQANPYYPYANLQASQFVQVPWNLTTTPGPGWRNIVSSPSVMRIQGTVGGDIRIVVNKTAVASDPTFPIFDTIIDEGVAPCGTCFTPRNGTHVINYTFPLKPFVILYFDIRTHIECGAYFRGTISRIGDYTPP